MKACGDSHTDNSHASAAAHIRLSCAITGSCAGGRVLRGRVLRGRIRRGGVGGTRLGHEHCLGNGRREKADDLRRRGALGEDGSREELELRSDVKGLVHVLRAYRSISNSQDSRVRVGGSRCGRSVASRAVRRSTLRGCCSRGRCRRGGFSSGAVRCSRGRGRRVRCLGPCCHGLLYRLGDRLCCGITALALSFSLPCLQRS